MNPRKANLCLSDKPVLVVGVLGAVSNTQLDNILDKPIFQNDAPNPFVGQNSSKFSPDLGLSVFYDARESTVFVKLSSKLDVSTLSEALQETEEMSDADFHAWLTSQELESFKSMLFMFHVCHHVMIMFPRPRFELEYLRIFRVLQSAKRSISPLVLKQLRESLGMASETLYNTNLPGQFVPSVTFFFPRPAFTTLKSNSTRDRERERERRGHSSRDDSQNLSDAAKSKRFRSRLEGQIQTLLRKCNILSAPEQERGVSDPDMDPSLPVETRRDRESHKSRETSMETLFVIQPARCIFLVPQKAQNPQSFLFMYHNESSSSLQTFVEDFDADLKKIRDMLQRNFEGVRKHLASGRISFSDRSHYSLSKNGTVKQLPGGNQWFHAAYELYKCFHNRSEDDPECPDFCEEAQLESFLDPDTKYSNARCLAALPAARKQYLKDLPAMYTSKQHQDQVNKAFAYFRRVATGPAVRFYEESLRREFEQIWASGRQLCDAESLTGKPCIHKLHAVVKPKQKQKVNNDQASVLVLNGDSPDSVGLADTGSSSGSSSTDSGSLPASFTMTPLSPSQKEGHVKNCVNVWEERSRQHPQARGVAHSSGFRSFHACGCGITRTYREDPFHLENANVTFFDKPCCTSDGKRRVNVDQMGWGMVKFGMGQQYKPAGGLNQEGFYSSDKFLLKWDIPVLSTLYEVREVCSVASSRDMQIRHSRAVAQSGSQNAYSHSHSKRGYTSNSHQHAHAAQRKSDSSLSVKVGVLRQYLQKQRTFSQTELVKRTQSEDKDKKLHKTPQSQVRCFVGMEYECHRGHRSLATVNHIVKSEKNGKIHRSSRRKQLRYGGCSFPPRDVQVQIPCRSRECNGFSQLQRIFLVTPEAPVCVCFDPVVQCAKPEAFFQLGRPVFLPPNSFMVLHLPYVYVQRGRPHPLERCRFIKGALYIPSPEEQRKTKKRAKG